MLHFIYDHTFDGLLTCVFDAYYQKCFPDKIASNEDKTLLFTDVYHVVTDDQKSNRVLTALKKKISSHAIHMLFACYMSELDGVEMLIFNYIKKTFASPKGIETNFADPDVLELSRIYKKVSKEAERMRQFVRFQKTADGIFFACIEPLYNVLPFAAEFFEDRFADQQWIIYDVKRKYALYYDLNKTEEVFFDQLLIDTDTGKLSEEQSDKSEIDFQKLWKQYFKSITIKERINLKLQRQHMPRRFWKYLPEKQ